MAINVSSKRLSDYLLEFASNMFALKISSQPHLSKHYQQSDVLEFKIFHSINKFLNHCLSIHDDSGHNSIRERVKALALEKFSPVLLKFLDGFSDNKKLMEQTLEKNEIFWVRSFLTLPAGSKLAQALTKPLLVKKLITELESLESISSTDTQLQDSFYRVGIFLQFFPTILHSAPQRLNFLSNYASLVLRKYLKNSDISHKFFNAFKLALEIGLAPIKAMHDMNATIPKVYGYRKVLLTILKEIQQKIENFSPEHMEPIAKTIKETLLHIKDQREQIKIMQYLVIYMIKMKAAAYNMQAMIGNGMQEVANNQVDPKMKQTDDKQKIFLSCLALSNALQAIIIEILDRDLNRVAKAEFFDSLTSNFLTHISEHMVKAGPSSQPLAISLLNSNSPTREKKQEASHEEVLSEIMKNEHLVVEFIYTISKALQKHAAVRDLILNLITSKYSFNTCLESLREVKVSVNEKRTEKLVIKLLFCIATNLQDDQIFHKTLNELLSFYMESQETQQNAAARAYIQKYVLKMANRISDPKKICIFFILLSTYSCSIARDNIQKDLKNKYLDLFSANLTPMAILLRKYITSKSMPIKYEMKVLEKLMDLWVYIILHLNDLKPEAIVQCKKIGFLSPNLVHASTGKSYTNFFLVHSLLNDAKIIQKYFRPFKHILRAEMPNLRPKVKQLTLGEMVFCRVLEFVTDAKLEELRTNSQGFYEIFKDVSVLDMILVYLKDIYLNEKIHLQCVMAEIIYRKVTTYIKSLLQMPSERSRMGLVIKDYSTLIQSSCSINIPYMKLSQIFLKEYVRQFSALVFREEVIVITCEVMHQLYIKCNQQYESVSSVLAVSSLNRHEIPLPTNRKDLASLFFFLMSCMYHMCLRGHLIDNQSMKSKVTNVIEDNSLKNIIWGGHAFNFVISTLRVFPVPSQDNNGESHYAGVWLYDKAKFEKMVESCDSSKINFSSLSYLTCFSLRSEAIPDVWKPIVSMPNSSLDMPDTKNMLLAFAAYIQHEGAYFNKNSVELAGTTSKSTLSQSFDELQNFLIRLFIYNNLLNDTTDKVRWTDIVKNSNLKHLLEEELKSLYTARVSQARLVEYAQKKYTFHLDNVLKTITGLFNVAKNHLEHASEILESTLNLVCYFPHRRVVAVLLKHLVKTLFAVVPSNHAEEMLFVLRRFLKQIVHRYNRYSRINNYALKKSSSNNLFKLESEVFAHIKYKELKEETENYTQIYETICNRFGFSDPHSLFSHKQTKSLEFLDLLSMTYFCEMFNWIHRAFMIMLHQLLPLLVSHKINIFHIYSILFENFRINTDNLEKFEPETVYLTLISNLNCLYLMKNSPYYIENADIMRQFFKRTLKFAFHYFAKDKTFYVGNELLYSNELARVERRMQLAVMAISMLRNETSFDSSNDKKSDRIPKVQFGYRKTQPYKMSFTNKYQKFFHEVADAHNYIIGNPTGHSRTVLLCGSEDIPLFAKLIAVKDPHEDNYFSNCKKLLTILVGHELDSIRSFYRQDLGTFKYDFTPEKRTFSDSEYKTYLILGLSISYKLVMYLMRKLDYALPSATQSKLLTSYIDFYHEFYFQAPLILDYYIEHNLKDPSKLKETLLWDAPQIPTLYKYVAYEYETNTILHIMFAKTMKRLHAEQLLFYLPQIFQSLNTKAAYMISKFLLSYAKKSFLFSHQLIWKSKVECKFEKESVNSSTVLPLISQKLLKKALGSLNPTERYIFENVDGFFESITAISGKLNPKWPKPQKKDKIKELVLEIQPNPYLYIPCNPGYKLEKIKLDSGNPMQSAAKCPILISFYCRKFEGPDKFYEELLKKEHQKNNSKRQILPEDEDEMYVDDEAVGGCLIHNLKDSIQFKMFPGNAENGSHNHAHGLHAISEEQKENSPDSISNAQLLKLQSSAENSLEIDTKPILAKRETLGSYLPNINLNPGQLYPGASLGRNNLAINIPMEESGVIKKIEASNNARTIGKHMSLIRKTEEGNADNQENKEKETEYELISCIFKVFDDIRQDTLALQVIKLFQYIFQTVGLDLYLVPYTTISNRTGPNLDIGGIIEVVPNSISRDQIGKINEYSLYEYFLAKFGREDSPEFQIARENFIKSMAAYSIVSYIIQPKDRHNGNLLIDNVGHLVHIDFGFIFDISPGGNMRFESANFKLNMEMIHIMGHTYNSEPFKFFIDQTIKGFLAIRRYEEHIMNLIKLMTYSGMKCFREKSMQNLKERFFPKRNDLEAAYLMKQIIYDAYNKLTTIIYDDIQALQQNIHRT